ncbi:MAG: DNA repair protein RecN [Clostridia bacterium]|nr:DNA repair protein RecN [Clostridia bacterium]
MLKYLHIENIAVIEKSDIEFTEGFNVLTGETGAGKSIIIDAINAVLGERTSKDLIRSGCDYGEVSALFGDFSEPTLKNLASLDISPDSDGNILITRKLSLSGKGLIKINGKPATAGDLREISSFLINIHGQHDNQALLNPEKHCGFIDSVADNSNILETYYDEFKRLNNIRKELQSLEIDENEKQRKIELLKYQIKELEDADIKIGEINDLKQKLSVAENFEQTQKSLSTANTYLSGDEETDGAITLLKKALKPLLNLNSKAFESNISKLNEIISIAEDLGADIGNTLFNNTELSLDVNQINHRLDLLQRLMLKYGNSEELMLEFLTKAKTELENIEFSDKKVAQLSTELENSKLCLIEKAKKLTNSRINASKVFEKDVCEVLSYLNMPNVKFVVDIKQGRYTKNGCDTLEFLISANAGENVKPLSKIASGGELSRTMLAIKSALLDNDSVSTMIFDEIDTGISGFAAEKVGTQLKKVSSQKQVICVTHLAQIAVKANNHLLIEKSVTDGRTYTKVSALQNDDRINEIARIMSGSEVTSNLYNSAKELLDRS